MAFTDLEKECLHDCHANLTRAGKLRSLTTQEQTDLDTILYGDEVAKKALAKTWAQNVAVVQVDDALANIDQTKTDLQAKKTALEALIAS